MSARDDDARFREAVGDAAALGAQGEVDTGAISLHEMYESYLRAGFTLGQSIYLAGCVITGNPGMITGR